MNKPVSVSHSDFRAEKELFALLNICFKLVSFTLVI